MMVYSIESSVAGHPSPQTTQSVNGFPITFREVTLADGAILWVPRGISRNDEVRGWRIYMAHEGGLLVANIPDYLGTAQNSLAEAYKILLDAMQGLVSRFVVDERSRVPGHERDPLIDTGVTGVTISRSARSNRKVVTVQSHQMIVPSGDRVSARTYYAGSITEKALGEGPAGQERKFHRLLVQAVAVRRHYNRQRSKGVYSPAVYKYDEVPPDIRSKPVDLAGMDLQAIMDSYAIIMQPLVVRTTSGDPGRLAAALQQYDLTEPHSPVWLEGRYIKFRRREILGRIYYLPFSVFRARGEWRIRVAHQDGLFCDSVPDSDHGYDSSASLTAAWKYAVSCYRAYDAFEGRDKPTKEPLLDTGIPSIILQPMRRVNLKSGTVRWAFSLTVVQSVDDGQSRRYSVGYWPLNRVTDADLLISLRKAAATMAYRHHLLSRGASPAQAFIEKGSVIPDAFWPDEPATLMCADDLHYYAELKEGVG